MNNRTTLVIGLVLLLLAGTSAWWLMSATPSVVAIESAKTPLTPVPTPNLTLLDEASFRDRAVYGTLPINVDPNGLGRDDPFAGTE